MVIKLWAEKNIFGLGWVGTIHEGDDMTRHGYVEVTSVVINYTEEEVFAKIENKERAKLIAERNKLMKQLEEVEAQL